jgi:hypothetical protein
MQLAPESAALLAEGRDGRPVRTRNLPLSLAFSARKMRLVCSGGVMKQASADGSAHQIRKDFGVFSEKGFLVAIGSTILLGAVIAGVILYGTS